MAIKIYPGFMRPKVGLTGPAISSFLAKHYLDGDKNKPVDLGDLVAETCTTREEVIAAIEAGVAGKHIKIKEGSLEKAGTLRVMDVILVLAADQQTLGFDGDEAPKSINIEQEAFDRAKRREGGTDEIALGNAVFMGNVSWDGSWSPGGYVTLVYQKDEEGCWQEVTEYSAAPTLEEAWRDFDNFVQEATRDERGMQVHRTKEGIEFTATLVVDQTTGAICLNVREKAPGVEERSRVEEQPFDTADQAWGWFEGWIGDQYNKHAEDAEPITQPEPEPPTKKGRSKA